MAETGGVRIEFECAYHVLSVRYFDSQHVRRIGAFAVPDPLRLVSAAHSGPATGEVAPAPPTDLVAWRSPTETWFLSTSHAAALDLEAQWAERDDGCVVVLTDGICIMRLEGAVTALMRLLARVGSHASMPALGEARTTRIADLPVTAMCVRDGEVLLAVERVYAAHLRSWVEATLADV